MCVKVAGHLHALQLQPEKKTTKVWACAVLVVSRGIVMGAEGVVARGAVVTAALNGVVPRSLRKRAIQTGVTKTQR
jgi:hypothetical protein